MRRFQDRAGRRFASSRHRYLLLVLASTQRWSMYAATAPPRRRHRTRVRQHGEPDHRGGAGRADRRGQGMNTNIRDIGAALGARVATSLVVGAQLPDGKSPRSTVSSARLRRQRGRSGRRRARRSHHSKGGGPQSSSARRPCAHGGGPSNRRRHRVRTQERMRRRFGGERHARPPRRAGGATPR